MINKIFNYYETFALVNIIENFKIILKQANEKSIKNFLTEIDEKNIEQFLVKLEKAKSFNKNKKYAFTDGVLSAVKGDKYFQDNNTKFENEHLARLYYYLPVFNRDIPEFIASQVIDFHTFVLKCIYTFAINNEKELEQNVRFFIRMVEIQMSLFDERGIVLSETKYLTYLKSNDFNDHQTEKELGSNSYSIAYKRESFYVKTYLIVKTNNMLSYLSTTQEKFQDFINTKKNISDKNIDTGWIDTTSETRMLLSSEEDIEYNYTTAVKKDSSDEEKPISKESEKEEQAQKTEYIRVAGASKKVNTRKSQKKQVLAISVSIARNKAMSPSLYSIPSLGNMEKLLKFIINKAQNITNEFEDEAFYLHFFVFSLLLGLHPSRTWKVFFGDDKSKQYDDKTNTIKIEGINKYFAKYEKFDKDIGVEKFNYVSYKLPFELMHYRIFLKKLCPKDFNEEMILLCVNNIMKDYSQTIRISWTKIWQTSLYYRKLLDPTSDITTLLATDYIDKNSTPRVTYATVPSELTVHSQWLDSYMNFLNIKEKIKEVFLKTDLDTKMYKQEIFETNKFSGSRKMINTTSVKQLFAHIKIMIDNTSSGIEKFNLCTLYVRYAAVFLVGTRDFAKSSDISKTSFKRKVILIHEKSKTTDSGYRIVPLSEIMRRLFHNYYSLLESYEIKEKRMSFIDKKGKRVDTNLSNLNEFLNTSSMNSDYEYLRTNTISMALNAGRHLYMHIGISSGISLDDIGAFMGHATNGSEYLGIYSCHKTEKYLETTRDILDETADIYNIEDLSDVI